jgi:hypothetical protein
MTRGGCVTHAFGGSPYSMPAPGPLLIVDGRVLQMRQQQRVLRMQQQQRVLLASPGGPCPCMCQLVTLCVFAPGCTSLQQQVWSHLLPGRS